MSDAVDTAAESVVKASSKQPPKKAAAKKTGGAAKKPVAKSTHPPASEMVNTAIAALKDKKGSSLQAIKKYIVSNYKVDADKQSTFIKKYLKSAVTKKTIVQTTGVGASGRFKLATKDSEKKVVKKPVVAKKTIAKKPTVAKKPAPTITAAAENRTTRTTEKPKALKTIKEKKTPSKTKKTGKASAAKPKTPKPKKAVKK